MAINKYQLFVMLHDGADVIQAGNSYALEYYINDKRVGGEDMMPAGKYDLKIPISEGTNDIKIYLVDGKGNMKSWSGSDK